MNSRSSRVMHASGTRRKLAAISLAVAIAAPIALSTYNHLSAADAPIFAVQQPMLSPIDALREGIRQYRNAQYEESVATLESINAEALSENDKRVLYETLGKAGSAAASRKTARAEFELGQKSLQENRAGDAQRHFYNVVNNRYVDEGTRRKAHEQLAVAEASRRQQTGDLRGTYASAVANYKAGDLRSARQQFETLQAQGFKPAMFQRTPDDYLRDIARRMPPPDQGTEGQQYVMPGDEALIPPAQAPRPQVAQEPAPAPEPAPIAPAPPEAVVVAPPPPVIEPAPAPVAPAPEPIAPPPVIVPAPEPIAPPPVVAPAPEPAPAPPPVAPAPAPAPVAPAVAEQPPSENPRELYVTARDQYKKGDWIAARQNFNAAIDAGYKPRLFEDSPQTYLARMDRKEQADARREAARQQREPQQPQQPPSSVVVVTPPAPAPAPAPTVGESGLEVPPEPPAPPPVAPPPAPPEAIAAVPPAPEPVAPPPAPEPIAPPPAPEPFAPAPAPAPAPIAPAPVPPPAPEPIAPPPAPEPPPVVEPAPPPAPVAPAPVPPPVIEPAPAPIEPAPVPAPIEPAPPPAPPPAPIAPAPPPAPVPPPVIEPPPPPAPVAPAPVPPPVIEPAPAPVAPAPAPIVVQPQPEPAPLPPGVATPEQQLQQTAEMQGVVAANNAALARQRVEQANAARQRNDFTAALQLYGEAVELDPNNQAAQAGRNEMLTLTNRAAAPTSPLDEVTRRVQVQQQEIRWNFETSLARAQEATRAGEFATAQVALEQARVARNQNPNIFPEEEIRRMETELASTQLALTRAQEAAAGRATAQEREQTAIAIAERERREREERQRTVADLRSQSQRLINETRYQEALGVLDQILVIDPTNEYAGGLRPLVEDKALLQQQRRFREDFDRQFTKQLNQTEEKKIPYDDILRYPANWPDITEIRDELVASEAGVGQADQATAAQLDRKLPELNFNDIGFSDVVDFLRDVTGANIFVNWRALEAAGVDRNAPVTARLRDVRFSKALQTILDDVGGGTVSLGYTIDEGVITISTEEDLSTNVLTRVYDIRDLIIEVPDFLDAPTFNLDSQTSQTSGQGGGGGGGGGQSLFGGGQGGGGQGQEQGIRTRQQLIDDIKRLIQDTVSPDSWRDAGGTVGSIQELSGQLIVTQTPENQRLLQGLLEQLRETRAIQVTVEARFLTVQRNYLEDIGMDLDVTLNARNRGQNPSWSPIPISQSSSVWTSNPSTGVPGSIRNVNNSTVTSEFGGLGLASLGLQGTYLDNFTVQFLIRATQAAQNTTLVTAPRLTLFNGQRAYVLVSRQTAYVSDLEPVVAQGAIAFNPTIGLVQSGVLLDVQATVSADRKYVTLTLRPQLATLLDLLPFTFQSAQGAGGATTQPITVPANSFGTNNPSGIIQQPILQITEVRTTVSVPDGGTLLLGGQTLAGEIEREAGVPVLSKIPFLKRLFTNRSFAKDEQILLILVKPTIVIQREQEQKQFPLLSTRITQ